MTPSNRTAREKGRREGIREALKEAERAVKYFDKLANKHSANENLRSRYGWIACGADTVFNIQELLLDRKLKRRKAAR